MPPRDNALDMPKKTDLLFCLWVLLVTTAVGLADEPLPNLDVPYETTHPEVVAEMLRLTQIGPGHLLFDLGCGDGRIVIAAAQLYGARGVGVDIDPQRLREAHDNARYAGVAHLVEFKLADIREVDLAAADAVTIYLLPKINLALRPRLFRYLKPGAMVVSHAFDMGEWEPDKLVRHDKARNGKIYAWMMPAAAGGTWQWQTESKQGKMLATLRLDQDFQEVTGAIRLAADPPHPISEVSLQGRNLKFNATLPVQEGPVDIIYEGVVNGDTITGTQTWLNGPQAGKYPWTASRRPSTLAGSWQLKIIPRQGQASQGLRLQLADQNGHLTATCITNREIPVTALYTWGQSLRFEVSLHDQPHTFWGFFEGRTAAGTVIVNDDWGTVRDWTATATNEKPGVKKPRPGGKPAKARPLGRPTG